MKTTARMLAFQTLKRVYEDDAYTNVALQHALSNSTLSQKDKGLCTEIVYGTVRRQITLDALLQSYVKRKLKDLDVDVLTILRMSLYQLAYLERVPAYAVIDEGVEIAKRVVRRASGVVNGVLRSYQRTGGTTEERVATLLDNSRADLEKSLSIRHGYPLWMVKQFVSAFGPELAEEILVSGNRPSPLTLRVNPLKSSIEQVEEELRQSASAQVERGRLSSQALIVRSALDVEKLEMYQAGKVSIQDEGAMLIAPLLQAKCGMRILDMCAAPGGKTTHIAELMDDAGSIEAYDVYLQKVRQIQAAAKRLGLQSITARLGDGRMLSTEDGFDAILVDAPCSGLGVMRRRPDIRHRRNAEDVTDLAKLQQELLVSACKAVRPGGIVVYATCTLLPQENQAVVEAALDELNGTMFVEDIREDLPEVLRDAKEMNGLLLTPNRFDTDGFYMTRLRRK